MRISYAAFELLVRFGLKQYKKRRGGERRETKKRGGGGGKDEFFIQLNNENKIRHFFNTYFLSFFHFHFSPCEKFY